MDTNNNGIKQNGWNEYSKLVLAELERLNEYDEKLQETIQELVNKINRIEALEKELNDLNKWRRYLDDVASPNTIKEMKKDVSTLNTFKTVATTVWAVVQIAFAVFIALFKG